MKKHSKIQKHAGETIGIDLGDKVSRYCTVDADGAISAEMQLSGVRQIRAFRAKLQQLGYRAERNFASREFGVFDLVFRKGR